MLSFCKGKQLINSKFIALQKKILLYFLKIICNIDLLHYLCVRLAIQLPLKQNTMSKTNLLLSLCAAAILIAIFTIPLLVCDIISFGVHLLMP